MSKNITTKTAIYKQIVDERRSWRGFKPEKISDEIMKSLLASVSYCPSSFGLEPWKVIVISNDKIKKELQKISFNQPQVGNASHVFVVLSYKKHFFAESHPWMKKRAMLKRNLHNDEAGYHTFYNDRFMPIMKQLKDWDQWSIHQAYIFLCELWLAVAAHDLGASAMEGIDIHGIVPFLIDHKIISNEDRDNFSASYILAVGYKDGSYKPYPKALTPFDETFVLVD